MPGTCSPTSARSGLRSSPPSLAARPAAGRMTFGYQRSEILAALVNGLLLVAVAIAVADRRVRPARRPAVDRRRSGCSASACSACSATSARPWSWLAASGRTSTSRGCCATVPPMRSARSASSSPAPSSSPVAPRSSTRSSASLIAALILASSWRLIKEPVDVLMEAAPSGFDVDAAGAAICEEEGVRSVHDLHIWTVTSGFGALAAHVVVSARLRPRPRPAPDRAVAARALRHRHTTLQMEEEAAGALLRVENAPVRPDRKPGCRPNALQRGESRLRLASPRCSRLASALAALLAAAAALVVLLLPAPPRPPRISNRSSTPRKRSSPRCANAGAC